MLRLFLDNGTKFRPLSSKDSTHPKVRIQNEAIRLTQNMKKSLPLKQSAKTKHRAKTQCGS
jgi:hypothetical protein